MVLFQRHLGITFSCILMIFVKDVDCGTVQTTASLNATLGSSLDLSFTYTLDSSDTVYSGLIAWSKKTGSSEFETIATFSPPGGGSNSFTTTESALTLKNRTELLNVTSIGSNQFRVVMRVLEVKCIDEQDYKWSVTFYNSNTGPRAQTAITTLTVQAPAERPYDVPVPEPSNIEEGTKITLSCTANVGKPPGKIKWWRYRDGVTVPFFVGESSETPAVQPGVCEYNVTYSLQPMVTKDDDQSVWRCSVENELLTGLPDQDKPNQETARINVFYKVRVPNITKNPDLAQYFVGSSVSLTCTAEGNPSPSNNAEKDINKYMWTFKSGPGDNATELASNNGVLSLSNLQESETGIYTCTAFNGFNGKFFDNSFKEVLQIGRANHARSTYQWSLQLSIAVSLMSTVAALVSYVITN